jgi:hypothetical protein
MGRIRVGHAANLRRFAAVERFGILGLLGRTGRSSPECRLHSLNQ